jgi:hypothetical protein
MATGRFSPPCLSLQPENRNGPRETRKITPTFLFLSYFLQMKSFFKVQLSYGFHSGTGDSSPYIPWDKQNLSACFIALR